MAGTEAIPQEWQEKFDSMMNTILEKMGIGEKDTDVVKQCGALRIRVYEAGEYEKKDSPGEMVKFEPGIDLKQGAVSLHVQASDLATLVWEMRNDPKLNLVLTQRLEEEKRMMKSLGF